MPSDSRPNIYSTDTEKGTPTRTIAPLSGMPSATSPIYVIGSARSDVESSYMKSPYSTSTISYEQSRPTRAMDPLSGLSTAAPTQYTGSSPVYDMNSPQSEAYDQIFLDGAGSAHPSFMQEEVNVSSVPYYTSYELFRVDSPSLVVHIPSGALSSPFSANSSSAALPPARMRSDQYRRR